MAQPRHRQSGLKRCTTRMQHILLPLHQHRRGGSDDSVVMLEANFSWIRLMFQVFFPFLHPAIRNPPKLNAGAETEKSNVYAALGLYMNISADERKRMRKLIKKDPPPQREGGPIPPSGLSRRPSLSLHRGGIKTVVDFKATSIIVLKRKSPLASFYAIPAVRFCMRGIVHALHFTLYLLLIFYCFDDPGTLDQKQNDPDIPWDRKLPLFFQPADNKGSLVEIAWVVFEVSLFLDRRHQNIMQVSQVVLRSQSHFIEIIFDFVVVAALWVRFAMDVEIGRLNGDPCCVQPCEESCQQYSLARGYYEAYQVIIAIKSMQVSARWFAYIGTQEKLGVLLIILKGMLSDTAG